MNCHRVLSRAAWSARATSRLLLGHLIETFAPGGPVVLGIDDTIERRRGKRIAAKGIDRDPVRSSRGHFVTLAAVRRHPWQEQGLLTSRRSTHSAKPRPTLQRALAFAIGHAA